jgi:amino acid adenylation domain-containing protein
MPVAQPAMAMRCIQDIIELQAALSPLRDAVLFGDEVLNYADLNGRAERLATRLRRSGAGPGTLIGVHLERSVDMVVSLLGILKAGAAYVPLDPSFPRERLEFMVQDAGLTLIVTSEYLSGSLSPRHARLIEIDAAVQGDPETSDESSADIRRASAGLDDVAYVIYTSGSTGRPKGVQVLHRGLVNTLAAVKDEIAFTPDDVLLAVTTLSFDIATLELLLPLMAGGKVVVASRAVATDGRALQQTLDEAGITVMQATPATWRMLMASGWSGTKGLRIISGGEVLTRSLANALQDRCKGLWNGYGPTETSIYSTMHRVRSRQGTVPIGRPIAGTHIHVFDAERHEQPAGAIGELYLGGAGVARGYLNRPELTAERFVPDPFDADPGARLYKTGDLVRLDAAGELEFLGRQDHQVKILGYRIELGEIETVIEEHAGVRQAVVLAQQWRDADDKRLVAYVVLEKETLSIGHELRPLLKQRLPSYMVPAAFVTLDALPMTPNNKVDRAALPVHDWSRVRQGDEIVSPRTDLERRLALVWASILGLDKIGVNENFFDLGSTSIDGARLLLAIETELDTSLPLGILFRAPTIERLAAFLQRPAEASSCTSLVPIQPAGSERPFFCVHGGAGTIYLFDALARQLGDDQPLYGFQSRGLYGHDAPHRTAEEMAAQYVREMRSVQHSGPYAIGGYCFGGIVAYEMARQLSQQGCAVSLLALFNAPNFLYYAAQGGDQRVFVEPAASQNRTRPSMLKRMYWRLSREVRTGSWWRKLKWRLVRRLGIPVPPSLRDYFFFLNNQQAERDYVPSPYEGRMVLFRAARLERDPFLGWEGLPSGGIEVHAIGADGSAREIMREPWVQEVASVLTRHLRSEASGASAGSVDFRGSASISSESPTKFSET